MSFFSSAIALAGFSPLGHTLVQFMIVAFSLKGSQFNVRFRPQLRHWSCGRFAPFAAVCRQLGPTKQADVRSGSR